MPREAPGGLRRFTTGYEARIRIGEERQGFFLATCGLDEQKAQTRLEAMAKIASALRRAGRAATLPEMMKLAAGTPDGKAWQEFLSAVDQMTAGGVESLRTAVPTFATFAEEWTSGKLHARFPDRVAAKDSDRDEEILRLHVNPHLGEKPLNRVTLADCEAVMSALPSKLMPASRRHVAQVVARVLKLACYPGRHIDATPIREGWLPRVKRTRAVSYVYPSEDTALILCPAIPRARRMLYGFLNREGTRGPSEALAIRWRHLDLERGTIRLDKNKTDDPRFWALRPDVVRALAAWKEATAATTEPNDRVFTDEHGNAMNEGQLARALRADLARAGIDRPELFEHSTSRIMLRAHDLRASMITIALANGRSETWVMDRTGHTTSGQLQNYRRGARTAAELNLGDWSDLDGALAVPDPVIGAGAGRGGKNRRLATTRNLTRVHGKGLEPPRLAAAEPKAANPAEETRETLFPSVSPMPVAPGECSSEGSRPAHAPVDELEERALLASLEMAAKVGDVELATEVLADLRALRARRADRDLKPANVTPITAARRRAP